MVREASFRPIRSRFLLVVFPLLFSLAGYAQYSSNIQGVVSDPAGAVINDASVELINVDTGVSATTKTSDSGNYRFSSLPPGNYVISATASGFRKGGGEVYAQHLGNKGYQLGFTHRLRATDTCRRSYYAGCGHR